MLNIRDFTLSIAVGVINGMKILFDAIIILTGMYPWTKTWK